MFSWRKIKKKKDMTNLDKASPNVYLDLVKVNDNKQKIIYILLILIVFLITILGIITFRTNTKTYIVEKEGNNYTYFGYVNDLTKEVYNPDDNSIIFFINNFINKSRYLPTDLVLLKKNQQEIGYFLNKSSLKKIDTILKNDGYPEMIKNDFAVDLEILSTLRLTNTSFQVRWIEEIYDKNGSLIAVNKMVGILNYEIKKPKNKEGILNNPLGIIITDLSMSQEK